MMWPLESISITDVMQCFEKAYTNSAFTAILDIGTVLILRSKLRFNLHSHIIAAAGLTTLWTRQVISSRGIDRVPLWALAPDWLIHWGRDKMAAIFRMTISNAFSLMKMYQFRLRYHWNLLPRVRLTIFQHWFRRWLGPVLAISHYRNQCWGTFK